MSKLKYYYGDDVDTSLWETMPYRDVLELKAALAYKNLVQLLEVHWTQRDIMHVSQCLKAIKFNENLLAELPKKRTSK